MSLGFRFLLVFLFVVLFSSSVFSFVDVSSLFVNAQKTADMLYGNVLGGENENVPVFPDEKSLTEYMDRFNVPEEGRQSWLDSTSFEEDFEVVEGKAYRIKESEGKYSDYFVWLNKLDFEKKQVTVYVIQRYASYYNQENASDA
ncbi:hypothetical protein KKG83_07285, partial [Candidatus Micrarchaeota archaeon]|nr:hypothetical protein [Candidatus Micrarchaeota archaeon]